MNVYRIRFQDTQFTANEKALIKIINMSSVEHNFYVEAVETESGTLIVEHLNPKQPVAVVVDGKIRLKSIDTQIEERIWNDIISESIDRYQVFMAKDFVSISAEAKDRKDLINKIMSKYKVEKR